MVDVASRSRTSSRWSARPVGQVLTATGLLAVLTALLVGVVVGSDVDDWDSAVYRWAPALHWPELGGVLQWWVMLGQRAICLALAAVWLGLRAWRERDLRPLGVLLVATLLTNIGVGAMKTLVGRLGPLQLGADAALPGAADVFAPGGTIFPSGHTANAVVTWGLLAWLARGHRRVWGPAAAFMAVSIGLTTIYLGTHWVSDVLAGWAAGGLVLLALPALIPLVGRLDGVAATVVGRLRGARRALPARMPSCPPTRTAVSRTVPRPSPRVTVS